MQQIKTNVIDPIYHSNSRTELRLDPNRVYQGGLRLGNLGCVVTDPIQYFLYNTTAGVLALIKNIYLYDGNQLLDQILEAHHLFGFRALQNSDNSKNKNAFNWNINQQLIGLTNSYNVQHDPYDTSNRPKKVEMINSEYYCYAAPTPAANITFSGFLNLTGHFEFLKKMVYNLNGQPQNLIDTNTFRNLRLVIEWRPANELVSVFQGTTTDITVDILSPQLYCDEVIGNVSLPSSMVVSYNVYEVDKLVCNAVPGAGGTVTTKARLNAFNGKTLTKLLLMNIDPAQLTNDDVNGISGIKCDGSQAYPNEVLQLYVNGETLFDFNGIDSDSRRLSMVSDAWGSLNIPLGSYGTLAQDLTPMLTKPVLDLKGKMSYTGCLVNQKIAELAVEHKRTAPGASPSFIMYVWGEVIKQVQVNNGSYNVMYV